MKTMKILSTVIVIALLASCTRTKMEKGFSVSQAAEIEENSIDGISKDSLKLETKPSSVLLTGNPEFRLTTIYKVNYNKKSERTFIGSNAFHSYYRDFRDDKLNQWNYNLMPGLEAVYGYNMLNISLYNITTRTQRDFFESPVLVKTLYYPTFSKDTLNGMPVHRDYYMVSVYDEDSNKDGFINTKDLRHFYLFDKEAKNKKALLPKHYSVLSSEYDSANDYMYVFAQEDKNGNGARDEGEEIHVFWIDLGAPNSAERMY